MVASSSLEHVGNQLRGDWGTRFVLLVLAGVWEVWNDGSDAARRSGLASIDHDEEFHKAVIDVTWGSRLKDEYCRMSV